MSPTLYTVLATASHVSAFTFGYTLGKRKTRLVIRHDCHQCTQPTLKPTRADVDAALEFDPFHGL